MAADVNTVKSKVQAILTEMGPVQIDRDGDFSMGSGSSRVFVRINALGDSDKTVINVFAPVLIDVPLSPELYELIARSGDSMLFGHFVLGPGSDDQHGYLVATHKLLGDFLDADELLFAVANIAGAADAFDDELQNKFGGKRFSET